MHCIPLDCGYGTTITNPQQQQPLHKPSTQKPLQNHHEEQYKCNNHYTHTGAPAMMPPHNPPCVRVMLLLQGVGAAVHTAARHTTAR